MSGILIILSFCLTTAGVGYLFMNYFIRKDLAVHKKYENLTPIEVSDLYEIRRRNYKIAALMFITSLISNTVSPLFPTQFLSMSVMDGNPDPSDFSSCHLTLLS